MIELKLLVIEDDELLLKKISKILKREITEVYSFSNPREALENISKISPDIILSDISMPEMTGLEMYKELKNKNINIPIILASAFSEPEYFIEAIKLKVKNFIVKPINTENLLDQIRTFAEELKIEKEKEKKERLLFIQSKMATLGEMLGNIAHQWKQPLNSISLCASTIQVGQELETIDYDKELKEYTKIIMDSVEYMNATINDFQNYLRPNNFESSFSLIGTIKKVETLISAQMKTNSVTLIKNIEDIKVCSFENELLQVIVNLFKNSIDEFVKKDVRKNAYVFVDIYEENDETILEIKDSAGGIPVKYINSVFDAYFTTKETLNGTGIGLYMSKEIIENKLEGEISVSNSTYSYENNEYTGALFRIKIKDLNKEI